ncbi:MAG: thiosulfate/3-mercaptopyruvate sulfurtransferase, partial [Mycobacterium sp.]|nr:thiosulfate/3-mercaptopyruvate sulfurtransferase [Mycobacterium sp.]
MLIAAAELADLIDAGDPLTILDVRWRLDEPDGRATYLQGHLPGAVYVSLDDELSDHSVAGCGRHPLPSGRSVEAAARRWGACAGVPTVVYDDWNRAGSARAWWVLTAAGIADVRILDGGLAAWRAAGG